MEEHAVVTQVVVGSVGAPNANGWCAAGGSVTFVIHEEKVILVDCGGTHQYPAYEHGVALADLEVQTHHVTHVICTHGHLDHIGNLARFPDSEVVLDSDWSNGDGRYMSVDWTQEQRLTSSVTFERAVGHTNHDVVVLVENAEIADQEGVTVCIAGDIFECEADLTNASLWQANSQDVAAQTASRRRILDVADVIVPGHGPAFNVPRSAR